MSTLIAKYPIDLTGRSPQNIISGVRRDLSTKAGSRFYATVLDEGGFYTHALKVYTSAFKLLEPNVDYIATCTFPDISEYTGMEVASAIVILNPAITDYVIVTAQIVGGDLAFSLTALEDTLNYLVGLGAEEVPAWGGFIGQYPQWQPGELQQERWARDHYGYLNEAIEKLSEAISSGNAQVEDTARKEVKDRYLTFLARFVGDVQRHIDDADHPHPTTAAHVGLEKVENFPVAVESHAIAGVSHNHYLTPHTLGIMLNRFGLDPLDDHLEEGPNAHNPTADQVGVYDKPSYNAKFNLKLHKDATAVDSNNISKMVGVTEKRISYGELWSDVRASFNASNFTGRLPIERIGVGTRTNTSILLANGLWKEFDAIFEPYKPKPSMATHWTSIFSGSTAFSLGVGWTGMSALPPAKYPDGTVAFIGGFRRVFTDDEAGWSHSRQIGSIGYTITIPKYNGRWSMWADHRSLKYFN